jgi:VIT1/CCC1 family predicted Fe2+/Mn2+ transporter
LDPASRLGEILFGLIMVLTITLAAGLAVPDDRAGARELLAAAIGCNIAWGIIDAVMYLMNCVTVRTEKIRLIEAVRRAPSTNAALELIEIEIEPELQELVQPEEAKAFSESVLKHLNTAHINMSRPVLTKDDIYGAVACFWLVFVSCLPASLPFLIFSRPHFALRVSNFLLIALLFLVGQKWAQYAGVNRLLAGSALVAIGLVLVGIAILLGG